jgi:ParB-like nuclease domain.
MPRAKRNKVAQPLLPEGHFERVKVATLTLDRRNPRFVEYGIKPTASDDEVIKVLWDEMAVDEVAMSIANSGFWSHEPLIVTEERGKLIVIEGNRRLAAVRILLSPQLRQRLRATDLPKVGRKKLDELKELPVVRVATREDAWPFIGFKHVNGPQKWRSYPKAQYIAYVKKATSASLSKIATQIGDQHGTVQELYRALMVIEQAEAAGIYRRENVKGRLAFSHLTTALQYPNFSRFLNVKDSAEELMSSRIR